MSGSGFGCAVESYILPFEVSLGRFCVSSYKEALNTTSCFVEVGGSDNSVSKPAGDRPTPTSGVNYCCFRYTLSGDRLYFLEGLKTQG